MNAEDFHGGSAVSSRPSPATRVFLALVAMALRHRNIVVLASAAVFALMAIPRFFAPRTYTATASFMPQSGGGESNLASLAAQFGVSVPSGRSNDSPVFYASLVSSREILSRVVETRYDVPMKNVKGGTLVQLWQVPGSTPAAQLEEAIRQLRDALKVAPSRESGTINVEVTSSSPALAAAVVNRILQLVNDFNVNRRQTQAGAERKFVDASLAQARSDLATAESNLQDFLLHNRQGVSNSPTLEFENERLRRAVSLREDVYRSLSQAAEQARINEARDVPVVTIIEHPVTPSSPNARGLIVRGLKGLIFGAILGLFIAFVLDFIRHARAQRDAELDEVRRLWAETTQSLLHPFARRKEIATSYSLSSRTTNTPGD